MPLGQRRSAAHEADRRRKNPSINPDGHIGTIVAFGVEVRDDAGEPLLLSFWHRPTLDWKSGNDRSPTDRRIGGSGVRQRIPVVDVYRSVVCPEHRGRLSGPAPSGDGVPRRGNKKGGPAGKAEVGDLPDGPVFRSEEHTSELQSQSNL